MTARRSRLAFRGRFRSGRPDRADQHCPKAPFCRGVRTNVFPRLSVFRVTSFRIDHLHYLLLCPLATQLRLIFFLLLVDFSILLFLCRRTICRSLLEAPSGGCRERQEDWQNQKLADPIAKLVFRNIGHAFYRAENPLSFALRMIDALFWNERWRFDEQWIAGESEAL